MGDILTGYWLPARRSDAATSLATGYRRRRRDCLASQERNNAPREPGTMWTGPTRGESGREYPLEIGAHAPGNPRIASEQGPDKGYVRDPATDGSTL